MTLLPKVKLKSIVSFPATILDGVGVDVVKQNGSYQFNIAYDDFAPAVVNLPPPDIPNLTSLLWNQATGQYVLTPVSQLGANANPSVANPLMDGIVTSGAALPYSREDHRHPTDTTLVSKSANLSDVVDPAVAAANLGVVRYAAAQALTPTQQAQARANIGDPASNVIINGDFRINQVGYVSGAALAAGVYGHDQWKAGASGGDHSFTQLKSSTQITIAAGKSLIQPIEDANVSGGSYVLSWTGTAQARAGINTLTPSGAYAASPLLITGQTAGTVMSVEFNAGTLGTVKLESGSLATPFIMRPFDQELLTCQRYYTKSYNYATAPGTASTAAGAVSGIAYNTTNIYGMNAVFKTRMRIVPQIALYSFNGTQGVVTAGGTNTDTAAASVGGTLSENSFSTVSSTGLTAGAGYYANYTADARL